MITLISFWLFSSFLGFVCGRVHMKQHKNWHKQTKIMCFACALFFGPLYLLTVAIDLKEDYRF